MWVGLVPDTWANPWELNLEAVFCRGGQTPVKSAWRGKFFYLSFSQKLQQKGQTESLPVQFCSSGLVGYILPLRSGMLVRFSLSPFCSRRGSQCQGHYAPPTPIPWITSQVKVSSEPANLQLLCSFLSEGKTPHSTHCTGVPTLGSNRASLQTAVQSK